jgi:hypothetical protein
MKNVQKLIFAVVVAFLLISTVMASGRGRNFRGTIVAFDPSYHSLKQASFVKNLEVTIARSASADCRDCSEPPEHAKSAFFHA